MQMRKTKVLFLCTGNSARSQMAEALLRKNASNDFEVFSAGLEPAGVNPYTIRVMEETGIDMSDHSSKSLTEYLGKVHFGYVITVCSNADEKCPAIFPGMGQRLHWPFDDPAALKGSDEEKLAKFREVRDQIEKRIKEWLAEVQPAG
jgi:arsenate reductase